MKTRIVYTKIWKDGWFGKLEPIEQNIFWYLLTNENTNILALFELPPKQIAFDTNAPAKDVETALQRFHADGKIDRFWDYILMVNAHKYETYTGYKNSVQKLSLLSAMGDEALAHFQAFVSRVLGDICDDIDRDDERHAKVVARYDKFAKRFGEIETTEKQEVKPKKRALKPKKEEETALVISDIQEWEAMAPAEQMRAFVKNDACVFGVGDKKQTAAVQDVAARWLMQQWSVDEKTARFEMGKFWEYWTEPTKNGKKQFWETKPTFEVKRRFVTWMNNKHAQREGVAAGQNNKYQAGMV